MEMKKLKCMLLIDDNPEDNYFHSVIIRRLNAAEQIQTATDGEKAFQYLENAKNGTEGFPFPDLILLDINMPRFNGFEFLDKVKEAKFLDADRRTGVIILTGSLNPADAKTASENFRDEVLDFKNKPLSPEMIEEILQKYF